MTIRLTIILFFICNATLAQKQLVVKDADTHQPLAFATAECFEKQWGTYSDSAGRIMIGDSIWKSCAVVFSFVGYTSKSVELHPQVHEILLTKVPHKLEDVVMKACTKFTEENLKVTSRKNNYGFGYTPKAGGFFWATFVPNKTEKKGLIKYFSYGAKRGNVNAPIRLRFFEIDTSTGLPANEITTEAITIVPGKVGWITEDISKYKIAVPETGIVAAFEMFDAGRQYHFKTTVHLADKTIKEVDSYGWMITGVQGDEVVGFGKMPGSLWFKLNSVGKTGAAPQVGLHVKVCEE